MTIIYKKNFPCKDYIMNVFGVIFARTDAVITPKIERHETIHTRQMEECAVVALTLLCAIIPLCTSGGWWWLLLLSAPFAFYLWYGVEWFYQWVWSWFNGTIDAYKMVTFEQEAYANDDDEGYNDSRARFAWCKYMFSRVIY